MTRGMDVQTNSEDAGNCIFYVTDYADMQAGHAWKMDGRRAMTEQMERHLDGCRVRKYTEYQGELLTDNSVGIFFPSRMWGSSLAVYTFLRNLRVSASTYVYAVAMGEVLSAEVNGTADIRIRTLSRFQDIFRQRKLGGDADLFIRCVDYRRDASTTEEKLMSSVRIRERIRDVLEGMLFYSVEDVRHQKLHIVTERVAFKSTQSGYADTDTVHGGGRRMAVGGTEQAQIVPMPRPGIGNLFLDDDLLSEVRICQAM